MKKRVICLLLCAFMLLPYLTVRAEAANTAASAAANYLKKGDYIVISPAEKWKATASISAAGLKTEVRRVAVTTTEWELTAQHSGTANGNDVQTWKFGVSDKFYIENEETKSDGISYVRIQCKDFRESKDGRYWDIEGRSKKPDLPHRRLLAADAQHRADPGQQQCPEHSIKKHPAQGNARFKALCQSCRPYTQRQCGKREFLLPLHSFSSRLCQMLKPFCERRR